MILLQPTNNNTINIALTGKMRSGKDTVAKQLIKAFEDDNSTRVVMFGFGDALKEYAQELFPNKFANGQKPRYLYQWFGQTMRIQDEDIWVRMAADNINHSKSFSSLFKKVINVITDLRQPNEYQFCKDNNFVIVKVECDDAVRLERMKAINDQFDITDLTHETEGYIDTFEADYTITTTHTNEEECMERVKALKEFILKK